MEDYVDKFQRAEEKVLSGANSFSKKAQETVKNTVQHLTGSCMGVRAGESGEGEITKKIESMTSRIPSATFLGLAVASIGLSAGLRFLGYKNDSQFVGQWVPTILILGLYNKLVKLEGSE